MSTGHQHQYGHNHSHDQEHAEVGFTQEFWDERYSSAERIWSGNANPHLVTTASELTPGTVLDMGSGEGGDAIWLATQGWQVTAVDVSKVALDRAAEQARRTGAEIAERITWQQADGHTWEPGSSRFDLVSAQFMYLPPTEIAALHRRLAEAVRPGGTLLIVGHHPSDLETSMGRPRLLEFMYTAEEVATGLDPDEWQIAVSSPERQANDPDGQLITINDTVLHAVRQA